MENKLELKKAYDGYLVVRKEFSSRVEGVDFSDKPLDVIFQQHLNKLIFDFSVTMDLNRELNLHEPPLKDSKSFKNELNNKSLIKDVVFDLKCEYGSKDMEVCYSDYTISDSELPKPMKEMGFVVRRDFSAYKLSWNEEKNELEFVNLRNNKVENPISEHISGVAFGHKSMAIKDIVFFMDKEDYETTMSLLGKSSDRTRPVQPKHIEFAKAYDKLVNKDEFRKKADIAHEFQHILNNILLEARRSKENSGTISLEEAYKLEEHNEKSASIAEDLFWVEQYHKSGDYGNIEIFATGKSSWLYKELEKTPVEKRKELVMNMDFIVENSARAWDRTSRQSYSKPGGQFENNLINYARNAPVDKIAPDNKEYLKQRSLLYRFKVYNPDTGKHEYANVSKHVRDYVTITEGRKKTLFEPLKELVNGRKDRLEKTGITKELVSRLKDEFRNVTKKTIKATEAFYIKNIMGRGLENS